MIHVSLLLCFFGGAGKGLLLALLSFVGFVGLLSVFSL
jgi:hypothetical protein